MNGVKVLVVEDSLLFSEMLAHALPALLPPGSKVERAHDPFEARDKILSFDPDVMVLDVELPKMNGIEFLRRLLTQYTQPTIVISGREGYHPLAINAGATDFVLRPAVPKHEFFDTLAKKIIAAVGKFPALKKTATPPPKAAPPAVAHPPRTSHPRTELIAIGSSTGGTEALSVILKALRPPLPGIVIVQHIPPMFSRLFAERLDHECALHIKEAADGDHVLHNNVYIAPGDKQMRVRKFGGMISLECKHEPRYNGHCPSVDVLFNSIAAQFGNTVLGVILTGMGADGSKGLLKMREAGARTLGQDEPSCVVYGMPKAAYDIGAVEKQLPLSSMATMITSMATH